MDCSGPNLAHDAFELPCLIEVRRGENRRMRASMSSSFKDPGILAAMFVPAALLVGPLGIEPTTEGLCRRRKPCS
jgi:hypothetical protein